MTLVIPDAVPVVKTVVLPPSTVVEPEILTPEMMGMVAGVEMITTGVPEMVVVEPGRAGVADVVVGERAIVVGAVMTTTGVPEIVVVTPEMEFERPEREEIGIVVGPEMITTGVPEMVAIEPGIITGGAVFVGTTSVVGAVTIINGVLEIVVVLPGIEICGLTGMVVGPEITMEVCPFDTVILYGGAEELAGTD